jgi:pilus assembly protein CpaC
MRAVLTMTDTADTQGNGMSQNAKGLRRSVLGWSSAVAVGTAALLSVMGIVPAHAQDIVVDTGGEDLTSRELVLPLGKAAIVELPRAASDILVSNPAMIDAVIRTPRRVYIMGKAPGQANAFFFDGQDRQILNLEIRVEQDGDVIEGLIAKLIPTSRVTVQTIGDSVALHGTVNNAGDAQRAVEIAERLAAAGQEGGGNAGAQVMNMLTVREPGQVMLKVRILEMERRLVRRLGIDLNGVVELGDFNEALRVGTDTGLFGTGALQAFADTNGFGDVTNLDVALDAFEQNGLVKTLAEPSLVALSGESASFFAGGRVGFRTIEEGATNALPVIVVQFENFGVSLDFEPTIRSKGSINIVLNTSVSDIAEGLGVDGIPGFLTRSATTTIDLPSGASFAIAGLLSQDIQESIQGVPGAKDVPVLGQLFRSQSFQSNETELVIIATPYLVEPSTLAELTDPGEGFVPPTMLEQALLGRLEAAYGVTRRGIDEAGLQGPLGFILD